MYRKMQASRLTEFIPFTNLNYLGPNPVSVFTLRSGIWLLLAFPLLLSNHLGEWQHLLDRSFGSPHSHLEAEIFDGCDISCLLIRQEIFSSHSFESGGA